LLENIENEKKHRVLKKLFEPALPSTAAADCPGWVGPEAAGWTNTG